MNRLFLEKLLENKHLFEPLLEVDNHVMNASYTASRIESYIELLLDREDASIIVDPNSLILSTGEIFETLQLFARISPNTSFVLFPNYSFMGMNHLFAKIYNLIYGNCCYLSKDKNYNCYFHTKDMFQSIYILGTKTTFLEMHDDFPFAKWIQI